MGSTRQLLVDALKHVGAVEMFVVLAGQPVKAEMMIVTLTAKGTSFFFHAKRAYSASWKTVKCVGAAQRVKRYRPPRRLPRRPALPPKTRRTWISFAITQGEIVPFGG
jgi:hypothetical protein